VTETATESAAAEVSPIVRVLRPGLAGLTTLLSLAWAMEIPQWGFDIKSLVGYTPYNEQFMAAILGLVLCLVYLQFPARRGTARTRLPWYDALASAAGLGAGWYVAVVYPDMITFLTDTPPDAVIVATIIFGLCIEGLRRSVGYTLVIVVGVFIAFGLLGHLLPGKMQAREVGVDVLVTTLALDTNGLFGIVLKVAATIVFAFVFFGQLLLRSGGSEVFNDFSLAAMGRFRGGSAKIAVTGSSLFGTVSGLAASNIMATGVVTIPLMRQAGYRPHVAAAIEAVASTGGQLMPPVMGAVAFLMADILGTTYGTIVLAALIPAILYYVALFIMVDLEAAKHGIARVEEVRIPRLRNVLARGWPFILPFAVLIYTLFWFNYRPETAAFWACVGVIAVGLVLGYGDNRLTLRGIWDALVQTCLGALDVFMIVAAAGFILGVLNVAGLGFLLTSALVSIGEGHMLALLLMAAVMCIILGMGMPTVSVYILLAVLIAPALAEVGVNKLAAHMFIFYFGMMSFITPPVAIAAFFAANLARSDPMRTGFAAMRFGWTAYIVPFLFVFAPVLLLQDVQPLDLAIALTTAVAGVWLVCTGAIGYMTRPLAPPMRVAVAVAGIMLMVPRDVGPWALWTDLVGLVLGIALVTWEVQGARRQRKAYDTGGQPGGSTP
jgi:TRAP transporter 4TM/12TM fusion protein